MRQGASERERTKMNALETKAAELVELAASYGFKPQVEKHGDHLVYVRYGYRLMSRIIHTDTGKANVKTWESNGRRNDLVSLKSLPQVLAWHAPKASSN